MGTRYKALVRLMRQNEVDQAWLSRKIKRSTGYISERMRGIREFTVEDAYTILAALHRPRTDFLTLFPPQGGGSAEAPQAGAAPQHGAGGTYFLMQVLDPEMVERLGMRS